MTKPSNIIMECTTGSHAYGTNIASSDLDTRGIFVGSKLNIMTPFFVYDEQRMGNEDTVYYELSKFMKLLVDQNPNILELLWVDEADIKVQTEAYKRLRKARGELLSKKVAHTFSGYAISQLKRIKGHNKWINNPQPKKEPKQLDFISVVYNFTIHRTFNKTMPIVCAKVIDLGNDMYGLIPDESEVSWIDDFGRIKRDLLLKPDPELHPKIIVKFNRQQYEDHHDNWKHYWQWKNNRNEKRSELEEAHGYDTKHAMHLIRLLRMGLEILNEGIVYVKRPDAKDLLGIRDGSMAYDEIVAMANSLEEEIKVSYEKSKLPRQVDLKKAGELIIKIYEEVWYN